MVTTVLFLKKGKPPEWTVLSLWMHMHQCLGINAAQTGRYTNSEAAVEKGTSQTHTHTV